MFATINLNNKNKLPSIEAVALASYMWVIYSQFTIDPLTCVIYQAA